MTNRKKNTAAVQNFGAVRRTINEGPVKKGGVNRNPSTPRPAEPPKGQLPKQQDKK